MRSILHIDANSAYLSWTAADMLAKGHPLDIRTVPSVIAGDPKDRHGIILAKSIPAKAYGIITGESLYAAKIKCPDLLIFPPDFDLYARQSDAMFSLLYEYSNIIERFSIDECWMDYTASQKVMGDPVKTACEIKERMKDELGFTVNIGVSVNKLLAKMGSELKKPDMVHTLFPDEMADKMWPLPISELFSVGRATAKKLHSVGFNTIGDIANADLSLLESLLKPAHGKLVRNYANGIDDEPVTPNDQIERKGVGNSMTTPADVTDMEEACRFLLAITERVASRLRRLDCCAWVIHVTIRKNDMRFSGKQRKLDHAIGTTDEIYRESIRLLKELWQGEPLRHFGISLTDLVRNENVQTSLFDTAETGRLTSIDQTVEKIRSLYGNDAIMRATFVDDKTKTPQGSTFERRDAPTDDSE